MRKGLIERARQRTVTPKKDPDWWSVSGHASLGDSYDTYDVHRRKDGSFYCSCTTSRGGEYRKDACSHRTAVLLWRKEHGDPWPDHDETPKTDIETSDDPQPELEVEGPTFAGEEGEASVRGSAEEAPESPAELEDGEDENPSQGTSGDTTVPDISPSSDEFDPYELDWDDPPLPAEISKTLGKPILPYKKFRVTLDQDGNPIHTQWHGIVETVEALDEGFKVVFLSAPTGSGKSLVAATVPQILDTNFVYTATTHTLQDQIEKDFPYAKVLKGRRNYRTYDDPDVTADECTKEKTKLPACSSCPGWGKGSSWDMGDVDDERDQGMGPHCHYCHPVSKCAYEIAKAEADNAHMAVLNITYFLSETNYVFYSIFRHKDLVIIDEADTLEEQLMSFITVEIPAKTRRDLGIGLPKNKGVEESWVEWIEDEVLPAIKSRLKDLPKTSPNLFGRPDRQVMRERKRYERLLRQVSMLLEPPPLPPGQEFDEDDDTPALASGWVLTGWDTKKGDPKEEQNVNVIFKPITVRDYARAYLWDMAKQFVLMSATIISPEQMAHDLGLEEDEWTVVEIPSSFPKERRPVVIRGEVAVTKNTMDDGSAYPVLVNQLIDIMEEHPDDRILVHSNSYKLTRELFFESRRKSHMAQSRIYAYFYSHEREKALNAYLRDFRGVLIAPSFERGVDLQDDDCRVVVIAKVPFPYLGDKQIQARLYGTGRSGKTWYKVETIRTICQMTGRGMRSRDDWAINYILDKSFLRIYWENQNLFPSWWREAIVFDETDPKWREPLRALRAGEL